MRDEKEIQQEIRRIKEAVKGLSGFWISESAAAVYALEWAVGKRSNPPSKDIGKGSGGHEGIAANLLKLAGKSAKAAKARPKRRGRA